MRKYFEYAGQTRVLLVTFVTTVVLLVLFQNLPINGEMLDLKSGGYSHEEVMTLMQEYGPDGRTVYAWSSSLLDTLFPLFYVTLFTGLIYRFRLTDGTWWLAFIPVVAGVVDLLENIQITAMLVRYPEIGETQVALASTATQVKSAIGLVYQLLGLVLFLVGMVRAGIARLR